MKKNLVCFSHLGWQFVYQRPQHLLTRFSRDYNVYYFEEPKAADDTSLAVEEHNGIRVVRIHLGPQSKPNAAEKLVHDFVRKNNITIDVLWYYTPMALNYSRDLRAETIVYDSMDELSAFRYAPADMLDKEEELMRMADVVFTGGNSLYQAKKHRHHYIHSFPSSIEKEHFAKAREKGEDPADQRDISRPRLGFYGVLDERFNTELLAEVAARRPQWNFVIIGPVVKIKETDLPKAANIHYLGAKSYAELPEYIRHWDIAMNMFALNDSTKYISPTKTPEYLAAGLPVISTAITDVADPYGKLNLVDIAEDADDFITKAEKILEGSNRDSWRTAVDEFLKDKSWDTTYEQMHALINNLN